MRTVLCISVISVVVVFSGMLFSDGIKCFFVKLIDTYLSLSIAISRLSLIADASSRDNQMDCHCPRDIRIFLQPYESFFSHHYQTSSTLYVYLKL